MDSRTEGESARPRTEHGGEVDPGRSFHLLFVCTGNTCRSPMASGLARHMLEARGLDSIEVRSAGVAAYPGSPASGGALRTAERHGIDLTGHRSALLTPDLVEWADLILTMSDRHVEVAEALGARGRASLITRFVAISRENPESGNEPGYEGVLDPIGGDDSIYEETFQQLGRLVDGVLAFLAPGDSG